MFLKELKKNLLLRALQCFSLSYFFLQPSPKSTVQSIVVHPTTQTLSFSVQTLHQETNQYVQSLRKGVSTSLYSEKLEDRYSNDDDTVGHLDYSTHSAQDNAKFNTLPRLYVGEIPCSLPLKQDVSSSLSKKSRVRLSSEQTHYLIKVMRIFKKGKKKRKPNIESNRVTVGTELVDIGQCVRLFDGVNGEWLSRIINPLDSTNVDSLERRSKKSSHNSDNLLEAECLIQLRSQTNDLSEQSWVLFAPIKKQRLKLLIEKCTELGSQLFCPILTDHTTESTLGINIDSLESEKQLFVMDNRSKATEMKKLPLIAREAAEQSERLTVPTFITSSDLIEMNSHMYTTNSKHQIEKLLESLDSSPFFAQRTLLVCRERKHDTLPILRAFDIMKASLGSNRIQGCAFLIGPEGGWSEYENALFDKYNMKYSDNLMMCVSLGSSIILRAETCAMTTVGAYTLWLDSNK